MFAVGIHFLFCTVSGENFFVVLGTFLFTGIVVSILSGFKTTCDDAMVIASSCPVPILVINSDLRVMFANNAYCENFRVSLEHTLGRRILDLGTGQWNFPPLIELINKTFTEETKFRGILVENDFPMIGFKYMLVNASRAQLSWLKGEAAILAIEDLTEQKTVERLLKASEEKYRSLVANAYEGIMMIREDGTIEYANPQIESMFGYKEGELQNQKYDLLVVKKERERHFGHHDQYMNHPVSREMGKGLNLYGQRKDGTVFSVDISLSPYKSNNEILVNCMVRDITEQKKIDEDRKRLLIQEKVLREEAIRTNRVKDEFLSTLSHELRTPLTTILGWAQELQSKNFADESVKEGLSVIERSAHVQGQLINDLLDVSRIQSGKLLLDIHVIDIVEVLRLAVASARILAEKKSLQIDFELPLSPQKVSGDSCRLQQVFWNLLTNAIKFTPIGGRIFVKLDVVDGLKRKKLARVQIKDTGIGIKSEFLGRIFERFSQADSSMARVHGGLGLGLAIVKSLVEMQNGNVSVESEGEGLGATFTVSLPLVLRKSKNVAEMEIDEEKKMVLQRLDGIRILVVDDCADNRLLFSIMLKSLGADVQSASSVKEGLQMLQEYKPDILLSDISMPEEDGYSFIRKIRKLDAAQGGEIPAIALTAYAGAEDIQSVIAAGFSSHVAKPVEKIVLSDAIANLIK